ncbi:unnamed protein product (macronuclear) [Paramecium tetraurelia]|uniref:Uncharacterized protein n=1 Tax=Paramecium tetraurelia TaxID=5888 RepID=A0DL24_PARTE|nr:uncharacterized protein GSPATT00018058001 [Paramecium tetraurelia]CAK83741.1 unnamed protein product [Paramecium tetraurelia]|eukprot:XP_001451138.1 hypothetical protein (macronuclear) [Paramecium tetraurelia strain d4-2]
MKYGSPKVSSNTIDVLDETLSPRKSNRPYVREKRSISNKVKDFTYDNQLFDKVDNKIRAYLQKNQVNYEKTLIKLYKLDSLKSYKAKRLLGELNQTRRKQQFSAVRQTISMLNSHTSLQRERNNSLQSSKQMQMDLKQIQQELKKINPDIEHKVLMNISVFKFNQSNSARLELDEWERVALQYPYKIRPKMTNFEQELDRLNSHYSRNEKCLNQLMHIQKDLLQYKLLQQ